jgi:cellobiose phosphorylase
MKPDFYKVEPYVTPGNVDGPDSPNYGRGGWTWYTGSSAWMFRVSTEWLLGVRPTYEGLLVRPCLPAGWKGFTMKRTFRGCIYRITVRTGAAKPGMIVDGKPQRSDLVPAFRDGREHTVELRLGGGTGKRSLSGRRA